MSKIPSCPKHKTPLALSEKKLDFAGTSYTVCIGSCQRCSTQYINRRFMSSNSVTIAGQKYEYLAELPSINAIAAKPEIETTSKRGPASQKLDDIERYFLKAAKEMQHEDEIERLTMRNTSLEQENERLKLQLKSLDAQQKAQQLQDQEQLRMQSERIIRTLAEKHRKELADAVAEYQARINRLNRMHKETLDKVQKTLQEQLNAERLRTATLHQKNAALSQQIEVLTKQHSNSKPPAKQITFIKEKLYVCSGTIRCDKFNHRRENVTAIIDTLKGAPISMTVCHCKDCNLYYIRDVVFDLCREKYGTLLGKFIREPNGMNLGQTANCRELAPESLLHINGYNVNQTVNLSPNERRKILTYVIESRIMDKRDIQNHLSYLIMMGQSNPSKAVAISRWRSDIQWVNDYRAGTQDTVWLSGTAMYKYRKK